MIKLYKYLSLIVFAIFIFAGCNEEANPGLDDLITPSLVTPEIIAVTPDEDVLGGVTELTIQGKNLPTVIDGNSAVLFNGKKGTIIETSESQIKVIPPAVISDSVEVRVQKFKSEFLSNIYYLKIMPAVEEYYPFDLSNGESPYAITIDNQENLYVILTGKGTKKIDTQGNLTNFAPHGTAAPFFISMAIASDNAIYGVRGGVPGIYRISEGVGPAAFVASAQGIRDNVSCITFDETRNIIWAGGSTGNVYIVTLDKNIKKYNVSGWVRSLKVANNNLFLATTFESKELIWRMPIVSADSLGDAELYFDFTTATGKNLKIVDFIIAEDGDLFIGTSALKDPLYVAHPDKSFGIFYPGLINSTPYSMVWGNGKFSYFSNVVDLQNKTVLRVGMQKNGAQ